MLHCANCGAPLALDAQFCPRCGHAVAKPPSRFPQATPATPPPVVTPVTPVTPVTAATPPAAPTEVVHARPGRVPWWIVPLVIVGIIVIAWLIMAGLPFGGRDADRPIVAQPASETIAEGTAPSAPPPSSATIVDVDPYEGDPVPTATATTTTTRTVPPPATTTTAAPPPSTATVPPPVIVDERPRPVPRPQPVPPPAAAPSEISESQAEAVLRGYVTSRRYYDGVRPECVQLRGSGYRNVGYGFSVWDSCAAEGGSRMLGRWRVDAKTQEVFVQRDDGRFLRP